MRWKSVTRPSRGTLMILRGATPGAHVARAQFGVPKKGGVGLDTQQRIVRTLAAIARVVADLRKFLTPEDGHHAAVEMKDLLQGYWIDNPGLLSESKV